MSDRIGGAIAGNDLDALNRLVDDYCADRDWESLLLLRDRARAAFERGFQLWPAAAHAAYRLALEAPGEFAAMVLDDRGGAFALGPLPEVAASSHAWDELEEYLDGSPEAAQFAWECIARGDDLRDVAILQQSGSAAAPWLTNWEPEYLLAEYYRDRAEFPGPDPLQGFEVQFMPANRIDGECQDSIDALVDVARAWRSRSDAVVRATAVEGDALAAIGSLLAAADEPLPGPRVRVAQLRAADAIQRLAWAGASSGPHGRRRGAAAGREAAWLALAAVAGLDAEPGVAIDPDELGSAVTELEWYWWQASDVTTGWVLRLAVHDPLDGIAFALDAHSVELDGTDDADESGSSESVVWISDDESP